MNIGNFLPHPCCNVWTSTRPCCSCVNLYCTLLHLCKLLLHRDVLHMWTNSFTLTMQCINHCGSYIGVCSEHQEFNQGDKLIIVNQYSRKSFSEFQIKFKLWCLIWILFLKLPKTGFDASGFEIPPSGLTEWLKNAGISYNRWIKIKVTMQEPDGEGQSIPRISETNPTAWRREPKRTWNLGHNPNREAKHIRKILGTHMNKSCKSRVFDCSGGMH
jgi:hypothetical protein